MTPSTARPALVWSLGLGNTSRAPGVHHHAAVRLLVIADPHHVDRALQPEQLAGEGERAAPLARAGFGGQPADAGALVVVRLRDRGIRLVAAGGTGAFVLVIDVRRGVEQPFPGGARDRAAWRATGGRCPSPRREYRSAASARIPARSTPSERAAAGPAAPSGACVCGLKRRVERLRKRWQHVDPRRRESGYRQAGIWNART